MNLFILILIIIFTLIFAFTNGFHDSANAIATVISTKVLSPRTAVIYGAILNFLGAFCGTHVAQTIGTGLVSAVGISSTVILCALTSAIIWNTLTWYFGIPSSSSHSLIGSLIGASVFHSGFSVIKMHGVIDKLILPMIFSPLIGMALGFMFLSFLYKLLAAASPTFVNKHFGRMQIASSGLMAFSHGINDTQKSMGIITLALASLGFIKTFNIPAWVIVVCGISVASGVLSGGWRIIRTIGHKIIKLNPLDGFAAETSTASTILVASYFGIPLSTTHVISGSIIGVGCRKRLSAVKWGVFFSMIFAWVITLPVTIFLSGLIYYLTKIPTNFAH